MKHALLRGFAVIALSIVWPLTVAAQEAEDTPPGDPEPRDIERVIETLEDPTARAELVAELKALLEAQAPARDEPLPAAGDVVDVLWGMVVDVWVAITTIDPRELVVSIALSVTIIVAALVVRWLILRLLMSLYVRLISGGRGSSEEVIETAQVGAVETDRPLDEHGRLPPSVTRLINLILAVLAVALIAETWGAGLGSLLRTDLGARIAEAGVAIGLILVITLAAWHVAGLVVARLITFAGSRRDRERAARRVNTLVPLLRSVLQGIIAVLAALLILSELGINIAPLLAGAGILGLAIGFGAQTLVKDLLSGVTILLEDGATVGDVVEVAGHSGVVEEMRVRLIRLRDLAGAVHFVPYSEVTSIVNFTKDFAYHLIELGVAYREDTDDVWSVLTEIVDQMRREPPYAARIVEPLEILGVDRFQDSAVLLKGRIRTRPGEQWSVGREFNRRLKKAFDSRGIEIPFPHTTVYFGEPREGTAPPARLAIIGAPPGEPSPALASPESSS